MSALVDKVEAGWSARKVYITTGLALEPIVPDVDVVYLPAPPVPSPPRSGVNWAVIVPDAVKALLYKTGPLVTPVPTAPGVIDPEYTVSTYSVVPDR
jgi:hypothetical protein